MATYTGSGGNNFLNGTNSADSMTGNAGDDTLNGLGGNDTIFGGSGNDSTSGGDGNDLIYSDYDVSENLVINGGFSDGGLGWTSNNPTGGPGPIFDGGVASLNSGDEAVYGDSIEQTLNTAIGQVYTASYRGIENNLGVGSHTVRVDILDAFGAVIYTRTDLIANSTN
ncbi:MAG: calcium-binding protein, partial [Cypionkella sp.]